MKRFFIVSCTMLLNSLTAFANPSELAASLQNSLTALRIPIEFIVTKDGNYIGPEEKAIAQRFSTENSSIFKDIIFSPDKPNVTVSELTDTSVRFKVGFAGSQAHRANGAAGFVMRGKFDSDIHCIFSSDFRWNCRYIFLDQNFGPRLWPNPIDEWNYEEIQSFMGPNKGIIQSSILKLATELVESKL